ncbi:MFS transporter [Streptomyces sp. SID5643]|uniref:MFS transporter n=1 Tax=Streptomyces sp. SID5643 TaxID=2690307 RepID=UPI00136C7FF0|nr:MFS transporter [Streptomyces sp. SID5643]MZF89104.1 MFS transporter [Streptomyces sp. SID5643]
MGAEFRKLWVGSALSNLGDGVSFVAIPLLAATLTDRPELVAALSTAYALPRLLVSVVSGAAVDRLDRRKVMAGVNMARGAVLAVLALLVWLDMASIWTLYGVFVVLGLLETLADVSAFSVLPTVVTAKDLDRANSRLAGAQTVCDEIAGPPLGGLLFGIAVTLPILFDAASFMVAAVCFWWLKGDFAPRRAAVDGPGPSIAREIGDGLRYLKEHRLLRALAVMSLAANLAYMLPFSVLVLFATRTLDLSPTGYGVILTVSAAGSLVGSAAAPKVRRFLGTAGTIGGTLLLGAAAYAVIAMTDSVVLVTAMLAVYFFYTSVWTITVTSLRQALIPGELLGRVAGASRTFSLVGLLVGSLSGGFIAAAYGLRAPFWCAGALLALTAVITLPLLGRWLGTHEEAQPEEGLVPSE